MALDIPSYLLGKSKGGGGEPPVLINKNITANGTYNASDDNANGYSKVNVNVEADVSEYFTGTIGSGGMYTGGPGVRNMIKTIPEDTTISGTSAAYMFYWCSNLTSIPLLDTSNVINMSYMFYWCSNLTSIPLLDTSNVTDMSYMLNTCSGLTTVPLLNTSKVTNFNRMFSGTSNLTDASVDNILQMCINATSYTGNKTLAELGFIQNVYTASRIQALPHYQDFIDAGWTIGY